MKTFITFVLLAAVVPFTPAPPISPAPNGPRLNLDQACYYELQQFCPGRDGNTGNACLQLNYDVLSNSCRAALGPPTSAPINPYQRQPFSTYPGVLRPTDRFGDHGVGGGIGGGEPHGAPGPFGPPGPFGRPPGF